MEKSFSCWKCGKLFDETLLPVNRRDECSECHADLHVCLMCEFFDKSKHNQCRESVAEAVNNKQRSNFCDYFKVASLASQSESMDASLKTRAELDALFLTETAAGSSADKNNSSNTTDKLAEAENTMQYLEYLFKDYGK